jgi:hypothetical protein
VKSWGYVNQSELGEAALQAAIPVLAARLLHVSAPSWGPRKYMNMRLLDEMDKQLKYSLA